MRHGQILQGTFAALIANRAIQRMRCEQKFDSAFLSIGCLCRLREDHHAVFHFIRTSGFKLRHELDLRRAVLHHKLAGGAITHRATDLYETHAAHANRLKFGMMTKDGDIDADHLGGIRYERPIRDGCLYSINR